MSKLGLFVTDAIKFATVGVECVTLATRALINPSLAKQADFNHGQYAVGYMIVSASVYIPFGLMFYKHLFKKEWKASGKIYVIGQVISGTLSYRDAQVTKFAFGLTDSNISSTADTVQGEFSSNEIPAHAVPESIRSLVQP